MDVLNTGWCPGKSMYVVWELRLFDGDILDNVLDDILDDVSNSCIPVLYV